MRITTLDDDDNERYSIEVPLRRLAASPDPLEAACWQKLLELVDYLQWNGPEPELSGWIFMREMVLSRWEESDSVRISVWADWQDRTPLKGGLPEMHYRFQIKRPGKDLTEDARAKDAAAAEIIIYRALGL